MTVDLPHISDDFELIVGFYENEATISYRSDHLHLSSDAELLSPWLPAPSNLVTSTTACVEWFLTGRIEVETHRRWYGTISRTFLINGERALIQSSWAAYWGRVVPDGVFRPDYTGPDTPD